MHRPNGTSFLDSIGVVGMAPIEPVVLAALITADPLLLIGPHGTGKWFLLNRISAALGLVCRHYNASLLNFDDLVGYDTEFDPVYIVLESVSSVCRNVGGQERGKADRQVPA